MSGVYFKGMQMPENCRACRGAGRDCQEWKWFDKWMTQRAPDCPLFAVPDHGRLIDADCLDKRIYNDIPLKVFGNIARMAEMRMRNIVGNAPTVIPADKEVEQ